MAIAAEARTGVIIIGVTEALAEKGDEEEAMRGAVETGGVAAGAERGLPGKHSRRRSRERSRDRV